MRGGPSLGHMGPRGIPGIPWAEPPSSWGRRLPLGVRSPQLLQSLCASADAPQVDARGGGARDPAWGAHPLGDTGQRCPCSKVTGDMRSGACGSLLRGSSTCWSSVSWHECRFRRLWRPHRLPYKNATAAPWSGAALPLADRPPCTSRRAAGASPPEGPGWTGSDATRLANVPELCPHALGFL